MAATGIWRGWRVVPHWAGWGGGEDDTEVREAGVGAKGRPRTPETGDSGRGRLTPRKWAGAGLVGAQLLLIDEAAAAAAATAAAAAAKGSVAPPGAISTVSGSRAQADLQQQQLSVNVDCYNVDPAAPTPCDK